MADEHGAVDHLFERECSIQRRKQKLIEEAPSPSISPAARERLCASAVAVAREVGYVNAGTVEFLVDVDRDAYYFIEVNARIQVEHGVTEMVTGIDLVAEQLRVAGGLPLSFRQEDIRCEGTALEFRINAEDPTRNFLPSPGKIEHMLLPGGPGVRVDTGVVAGCSVQPFYDSMVAKLLVHGRDRAQALARARRALDELEIEGVSPTQPLHRSLLDWPGLAWPRRRRTHSPWRPSSPLVLQRLAGGGDDPPRGAEAVAALPGGLAGLGVAGEGVERVAGVGDLARAVRALGRAQQRGLGRAAGLGRGGGRQRRPCLRAGAAAGARGALVGVPEVEGAAVGVDEERAQRAGLGAHGRRCA